MCMRAQNPADGTRSLCDDGSHMPGIIRPRINHDDSATFIAKQIGVDARHRTVVDGVHAGRCDACQSRLQRDQRADPQLARHLTGFVRIKQAHFRVGVIAGGEQFRAIMSHRADRCHRQTRSVRARIGKHFGHGAKGGELFQRATGRKQHMEITVPVLLQCLHRIDPHMVVQFGTIMRRHLLARHSGDEETGIKAPRSSRLRDPVTEINKPVQAQAELVTLDDFKKRGPMRNERGAVVGKPARIDHQMAA